MVSISLLARCDSKLGEEGSAATLRQALASPASVFGYESVDDWSSSAMLDSADTASEGSASLAVNGAGWTEVTSVELGSLGAVKDTASVDVMLPSLASWGEVKLVFKIPSIGEHWRELGSSSLVDLEPGVFHTLSFPVPEDLRSKLADEVYQDFRATVIINGPTGTYLLDRLDVLGESAGPPDIGPTQLSFSLTLPEGVEPGEFTLAAAGQLHIKDRVEAHAGGALTPVYNAAGASELGGDSKLGGLQSVGDVLLRNRAFIAGDVVSSGTIEKQYPGDVTILGDELENQEIPTHSISWSTVKPPAVGDVHLEPQTSKVLTPGSYDEVTVKSDADLYLRANEEYFFRTLTLDGRLILENTAGQIFVYVDETFVHRGEIVGLGNAPVPDLLVALSGAGTAHVESAFPGTLVAPGGTIVLQPAPTGGHQGAFYAQDLSVEPDTIVHQRSFPWEVMTGVDISDATPWIFDRSPVTLSANRDYDPSDAITGTVNPEAPVTFEVPGKIPVEGGNAGNGTLTLSFDHDGERVTCTYRGGATTLTDKSPLERARGMYYVFDSCTNGLEAGATTEGTDFELEIVEGAPFAGRTSVELELGVNGCSGPLLPLIDPADSLQMAEEFSWGDTTALPETNPNGDPTLYYANIYIERYEQLALLDAFFIHHDIKPVFTEEYEPWFGKCGTLDNAPDGHGLFVYAILPGGTYNLLRAATSHPDAPPEDRIQFKAIVLREPPTGTTYADGSLRYDVLQEAGFQYMNLAALPPLEALDEESFGGGVINSETVSNVLDVRAWVAQGAHLFVDGVMLGLGWIDRFLYGHVNVTANLTILNRDPLFEPNTPMQRGWGNRVDAMGNPIALPLPGVRIEINQWALRPTGGYLPTKYWGKTNRQGVAHVEVGRNNGGLAGGTTARGTCVRWANDTAAIRSGLTINETCDFRDDPDYDNFEHSVTVDLRDSSMDGHVLAAMTEAADYAHAAGLNVRHAEILTGPPAANVSPAVGESEQSLPWAPCLTFRSLSFDALQLAAKGFYPFQLAVSSDVDTAAANFLLAGAYNEMLDNSDIVIPRHAPQRLSRGYAVHEYGHFIMCNFLHRFDPDSLALIGLETILEGPNPVEPNDHVRIANEAFADFISAQVVGATNYAEPLANFTLSQAMRYCDGRGLCLEGDANLSNSGDNQITRFVTLLHDVYDGMRAVNAIPTNGDNFLLQPAASGVACSGPGGDCLTAHATSYGFDPNDDRVALPASSLDDVIFWGLASVTLSPFSTAELSSGLGTTMLHHGVNWCDMCDVFVRHDPGNPMGTLQEQWQHCTQLPLSSFLPVGPPEPDLRMSATDCTPCAANEISDANGVCVPCAGTVVGNACGCAEHQIQPTPGTCVECAAHELADQINNICVPCSVDQVVDVAAIFPSNLYCDYSVGNGPGDTCPDVVVADIVNLDAYLTPGLTGQLAFDWTVPLDDCEGPTYLMFLDDTTSGAFPFHGFRQGAGTIASGECNEQPTPALGVDASVIAAGLSSVRVAIRSIDPAGADMDLVVRPFNHMCPVE